MNFNIWKKLGKNEEWNRLLAWKPSGGNWCAIQHLECTVRAKMLSAPYGLGCHPLLLVRLHGAASDFPKRNHLTVNSLFLWCLRAFSLFQNDPRVSSTRVVFRLCWELGPTTLHFGWLWFSAVVSSCCKEKFLWWRVRTILVTEDLQLRASDDGEHCLSGSELPP